MAVGIEFANVIIRKQALAAKYRGGLDAFVTTNLPNYIEDANLVRVGFMSTREAFDLADELKRHGLTFDDTSDADIAIVQHGSCPDWLATGPVGKIAGCWLPGTDPGPVIKCTNGFLLRCPWVLYQQIQNIVAKNNVTVSRAEPREEDRNDFIELLHFSRGEAMITANVFGRKGRNGPVGLWACRDLKRRNHCAIDIELAEVTETLLLENGAAST